MFNSRSLHLHPQDDLQTISSLSRPQLKHSVYTRRNSQIPSSSNIILSVSVNRSKLVPSPSHTDSGSSCRFHTDLRPEREQESTVTPRLPDITESPGESTFVLLDPLLRVYDLNTQQSEEGPEKSSSQSESRNK